MYPSLGDIGEQEFLAGDGFGGEVAAADGAFHGGGPAGAGPIAGQDQVGDRGAAQRAAFFQIGSGGESSADFFDDVGLFELGFGNDGEKFGQFADGEGDNFGARHR